MTLKNVFGDLNLEATQQQILTAIQTMNPLTDAQLRAAPVPVSTGLQQPLTDTQLRASAFDVNANIEVGNSPVGPSNPVPITGNVAVSGAELQIEKAIEDLSINIQAAPYVNTTAIGGDYKLNRIELKFSTTEPRNITITSIISGSILYQKTANTGQVIELYGEGEGFNDGDQIKVEISQTTGACLASVTVFIERGALPLTGDPSIGGFSPTYYSATCTGTGVLIGPAELGSKGFLSLHVRHAFGAFVGTIVVEGTNDPAAISNWTTLRVEGTSGLSTNSIKNAGIFFIPTTTRWARIRCSSYTSGSTDLNLLVSPQARASTAKNIQDKDGIASWAFTPFGTGKVAQSLWQAGSAFDGVMLNLQEWKSVETNSGSYAVGGGEIRLRTNAANAGVHVSTRKLVEFLGDAENEAFFVLRTGDTGTVDNFKRWGVFDDLNGFFIEQYHDGVSGKLRAITRKDGVDTVDTLFPLGVVAPTNNTSYQFWRFVYTPSFILVYQGSNLVHLFISGTTNPLSPLFANFTLPGRIENVNTNGSTVDTSLYCQQASVSRLAAQDSREVIISKIIRTHTPLPANTGGSDHIWESAWEDCQQYPHISLMIYGNPRNARGTVEFYFTENPDEPNAMVGPVPFSVDDLNLTLPIPLINYGPFFKVRYTNNGLAQTEFRLHAILFRDYPGDITRFQLQSMGPNEPVKVVRALVEPSLVGERGLLGADREIFGAAIVGSRISRISLKPTASLAANDITVVQTNGTVTQEPTYAEFRLQSAAATATCSMTSNVSVRYRTGKELYLMVPARFTVGIANTKQRVGHFTDNNGFFFGYEDTVFGFTVRRGGIDYFTPLANANGDPLDGTALSRFNRGNRLEVIDTTKKNVWRLRVGLLGSSTQFFDVQSPDGVWMRVHTHQFANLLETASILEWDLPFRAELIKTGAATTNVVMGIGSVDSGYVGDPYGLEPSGIESRVNTHVQLLGEATSGIKYPVPTGRRFVVKSVQGAIVNSSTTAPARVRFRDSSTGNLLFTMTAAEGKAGVAAVSSEGQTFQEGMRVNTNVYMEIVSGTVTVDAVLVGYLELL